MHRWKAAFSIWLIFAHLITVFHIPIIMNTKFLLCFPQLYSGVQVVQCNLIFVHDGLWRLAVCKSFNVI